MNVATAVSFDADLMRRYDREGPRYTSYPTALQFREGIGDADYAKASAESRGAVEEQPLSLYVHIPFCFSPCFYCGCNKVVTRHLDRADTYVRQLLHEISRRSTYFKRSRVIEQMHFGGGTPTFLPKKRLIELIDRIDADFKLTDAESRDYSIEIDPRAADGGVLQLLTALGFNRISLGVQDFDEKVQRAVNRVQPAATVGRVYDAAMWIAGVMQGLMWRATNADGTLTYTFVESLKATYPYYVVRLGGGLLFLIGMFIMLYNVARTVIEPAVRTEAVPVPAV